MGKIYREHITPGGKRLTIIYGSDEPPTQEVPINLSGDDLIVFIGGQIDVQNLGAHGGETKWYKGEISDIKLIGNDEDRMLSVELSWCYSYNAEFEKIPVDRVSYNLPLQYCKTAKCGNRIMISQEIPTRLSRVFKARGFDFEETEGDYCVLIPLGDSMISNPYDLNTIPPTK